jgi:hypothetical protein
MKALVYSESASWPTRAYAALWRAIGRNRAAYPAVSWLDAYSWLQAHGTREHPWSSILFLMRDDAQEFTALELRISHPWPDYGVELYRALDSMFEVCTYDCTFQRGMGPLARVVRPCWRQNNPKARQRQWVN